MEAFERSGIWWFPQLPDEKISGVLKFDPVKGGALQTVGENFMGVISTLFGMEEGDGSGVRLLPDLVSQDIILGDFDFGEPVTLYKCRSWGFSAISVGAIFEGCHFEREEDIVFDSMKIRYSHLENWINTSGIHLERYFDKETNHYSQTKIIHNPVEPTEFPLSDKRIIFHHSMTFSESTSEIRLASGVTLEIAVDRPQSYSYFHSDLIYPLRNLISLGLGRAVLPASVQGISPNAQEESRNGEIVPSKISIYYVARGTNLDETEADKFNSFNALFLYTDIADDFQTYIQNWFSKSEKLKRVFDLYFGLYYIPSIYIHLEFLTLAQALETYHRELYQGFFMSQKDYESIRKALIDAIPNTLDEEHCQSLKDRITWGYEYPLLKRLERILNDTLSPYKSIVDKLVDDSDKFAKTIKNTRNYYTHYGKKAEKKATTDPNELYVLVQKMKLLMQLCFLREMDLPPEIVGKIVKHNRQFQTWLNYR